LFQSGEQIHLATVYLVGYDVAGTRGTETAKDRANRLWILVARLDALQMLWNKDISSVMSKFVDKLAAFLPVGQTKYCSFTARRLDERFHEGLLMRKAGPNGGCSKSTELASVALKRSWRHIFRWQKKQNGPVSK
jgi:hypothetical protein